MNKDKGDINKFTRQTGEQNLKYYFMTGHPGSSLKEAKELAQKTKHLNKSVQLFTPTPMTMSTCMYYAGMDENKKKIYVPYTYNEKKVQKSLVIG